MYAIYIFNLYSLRGVHVCDNDEYMFFMIFKPQEWVCKKYTGVFKFRVTFSI